MNSRPLVIFTCFFIAGILLAAQLPGISLKIMMSACGLLFFAALAGYIWNWQNNCWIICLLFTATGFALAGLAYAQINPALNKYCGHWVTVEGTISSEADIRPEVVYYHLNICYISLGSEKYPLDARVLLRTTAPCPVYNYGDSLSVHGMLSLPGEPGNPGEFDYRAYLERRGIGAILKAESKNITRLGIKGNPITRQLLLFKEKLLSVSRQTLSPSKAALVNGIVFGTQGEIPRDLWQLFSQVGIVHILSVSGMHTGLVLAGILLLLNLFRTPQRWLAPLASIALIFYAILSGMGPAVTRATLMGLLFLWAHHLGRDQDWPTTLSVAALLSLLLNPLTLYDIGFQLSFAATWGIFYLGPVFSKLIERLGSWPGWLKAVIWVSLAAQLATLPLVTWYYNIISPVSLLANILAAPLTGLILALGIVASLAGIISIPLAGLINASTSLALDVFTSLVSFLPALPGAVLYVPTPAPLAVMACYPLLCLGVLLSSKKEWPTVKNFIFEKRRAVIVTTLGVILLSAALIAGHPDKKELFLHLIDVGQGDSILVQTPGGKNILVDAGGWSGEFESGQGAGDRVVVPYLRRLGVKRIDLLIITHPHEDHAGGVKAVARTFPIDMAIISPIGFHENLINERGQNLFDELDRNNKLPPAYLQLLTYLVNQKTSLYTTYPGDKIKCDAALEITVLAPPFPLLKGTRADENNASIVLIIRYRAQAFLLTGDIETEAQEWLLKSGSNFQANVLKMPHHGSRHFLPAFLENVQPSVALISVGKYNRFGLPANETLELLKKHEVITYRTDEQGAIILSTDGKNLRIKTQRDLRRKSA